MKKLLNVVLFFIFISHVNLYSQQVEKYKNTCRLFDNNPDLMETGFIAVNDSILLTNYKDSVSVLNVKTCQIIKRLNYNLVANFNADAAYEMQSPVVAILRDNGRIWFRALLKDGKTWFGYLAQDFSFVKLCQINTPVFLFSKKNKVFYACVHDGVFVNKGSSFSVNINSGLISFTEEGILLNEARVKNIEYINGGERLRPVTYPVLSIDDEAIYFGTSVNCWGNPSSISNSVYVGNEKINCSLGGNQSLPYILLKLDTTFKLLSKFIFEGVARDIQLKNDSVILLGSGGRVYLKDIGAIQPSLGPDYHYRIAVDKRTLNNPQICNFSGSGGSGGWFDPYYFPPMYFRSAKNINYITFKGTIYFDKPYTSGGGQNVLFGYNSSSNCQYLENIVHINSQKDIWANLAEGENINLISICKSPDFWIGNNRINKGGGIYYFGINRDGLVDLSKINGSLNYQNLVVENEQVVSPNPTFGIVKLKNFKENEMVLILDQFSRLVDFKKINADGSVDICNLANGLYYLKFGNDRIVRVLKIE